MGLTSSTKSTDITLSDEEKVGSRLHYAKLSIESCFQILDSHNTKENFYILSGEEMNKLKKSMQSANDLILSAIEINSRLPF